MATGQLQLRLDNNVEWVSPVVRKTEDPISSECQSSIALYIDFSSHQEFQRKL